MRGRQQASCRLKMLLLLTALVCLLLLHMAVPEPELNTAPGYRGAPPINVPPTTAQPSPAALQAMTRLLQQLNDQQRLQLPAALSATDTLEPDAVVVVVQVHTRLDYLRYLVSSLRLARGVERVLLVFSHDVYNETINAEIASIDFCRVLQIFYPHSLQLNPRQFPGQGPADCRRDMIRTRAVRAECANAAHPDSYGHYREARYTQTKHHWWWKANRVFDELQITRQHAGLFLFLEEDHYVVPDFLHMLRLLQDARHKHCPHCNVLSLGTYMKTVNYRTDAAKVELTQWYGSKHNMGMALERRTWNLLRNCSVQFCTFDDYNWDWSLQYVSQTGCIGQPLQVIMLRAPRVFHIGECGVHHKGQNCDRFSLLTRTRATVAAASNWLFPESIASFSSSNRRRKVTRGNGGWGDLRDHRLCMSFSKQDRTTPPYQQVHTQQL